MVAVSEVPYICISRPFKDLLSVKQPFRVSVFGLDQELATKWHFNGSTGLMIGAFCTILRA